jgi:hypothetical protein
LIPYHHQIEVAIAFGSQSEDICECTHPSKWNILAVQDVWNPALQVKIYISHKLMLYV